MNDTVFYTIFALLFGAALSLQTMLCYRIGVFGQEAPKTRVVFVESKKAQCSRCCLDDNDWKELKAEAL